MCATKFSFVVDKKFSGRRVDFLVSKICEISRKESKRLVESGGVFVNSLRIDFPSKKLYAKDLVEILFIKKEVDKTRKVDIIFKDSDIIVLNKPPFLNSVSNDAKEISAETLLKRNFPEISGKIFPVHRLDKETSGVMVFAIGEYAKNFLEDQFRKRLVKKKYIAIVEGNLKYKKGKFAGKLNLTRETAFTKYKVVKQLEGFTFVEVYPETGRTHQIRIQFFESGHPVAGDKKYFFKNRKPKILPSRHLLHSAEISFQHPLSKEMTRFEAPIPDEFKNFFELTRLT